MILKSLRKLWRWLTHLGVSEESPDENILTKLINQLSFTTSVGSIITLIVTYTYGILNVTYGLLLLSSTILYILILVLNGLGKRSWIRFYIATILPLWIPSATLYIGGHFNAGVAAATNILIVYLLYERFPRQLFPLVTYNMLLYILPSIYVYYQGPIYHEIDIPFDELIVFALAINWIWVVFAAHNRKKERLIEKLRAKNEALQQTTEELERFSYIASHDLKSPLRTVVSFLGLIEKDIKRGKYDDLQTNLEFAKSGAKQMNYLVSDILELSKLNAPDRLKKELVDLNIILKKVKSNLQEDLHSANASIIAEPLPNYYCNEVEFLMLFQNIIQNGIKYNHSTRPTLTIWSENGDDTLKIHFKDNGIGIEEAYFTQIFQFFKRLHTTDEYSGTGLGLGLCKKIIQKYKGDISVKSQLDKGSTFSVYLPCT